LDDDGPSGHGKCDGGDGQADKGSHSDFSGGAHRLLKHFLKWQKKLNYPKLLSWEPREQPLARESASNNSADVEKRLITPRRGVAWRWARKSISSHVVSWAFLWLRQLERPLSTICVSGWQQAVMIYCNTEASSALGNDLLITVTT